MYYVMFESHNLPSTKQRKVKRNKLPPNKKKAHGSMFVG